MTQAIARKHLEQSLQHFANLASQRSDELQRSFNGLLLVRNSWEEIGSGRSKTELRNRLLEIVGRIPGVAASGLRLLHGRQSRVWTVVGDRQLWRRIQRLRDVQHTRTGVLARRAIEGVTITPDGGEPIRGYLIPLRAAGVVTGLLEVFAVAEFEQVGLPEILSSLVDQEVAAIERLRLHQALTDREKRLAVLIGKLMVAQEDERQRISYEVHEGVAQIAAATHMQLQAFAARHHFSQQVQTELDRIAELARKTVMDARRIIADLRPLALDDFGLVKALEIEVKRLQSEGWEVTFAPPMSFVRPPVAFETALFRVAHEALDNIKKHAGKARIQVSVDATETAITLIVEDWGVGFSTDSVVRASAEHIGHESMQERVRFLRGTVNVTSVPGQGTRVEASLPLRRM